ncbi:TPA: hypothetical protein N0F65_001998 [Lagenidium giganteum]|uniref:Uncharacterized protein n=1 Tax=Lagenidium giganteum TaxID=4803 RepID=A0AAV2Z2Z4_9STRA|nr:TPA: hypothetical protein N0F65_001998 [Lagenidium giganteum]
MRTSAHAMAMAASCEWCGEQPIAFRCRMCNPRKVLATCTACAKRWHSRGFSQEHVVEDLEGTVQAFKLWSLADQNIATPSTTPAAQPAQTALAQAPAPAQAPPVRDTTQDANAEKESNEVNEDAHAEIPVVIEETDPEPTSGFEVDQDAPKEGEETNPAGTEALQLTLDMLVELYDDENVQHEAQLTEYLTNAIAVEDAVHCVRFSRCSEQPCAEISLHHAHVRLDQPCTVELCQQILEFQKHRKNCELPTCPFCIRGKFCARQHLGAVFGFDHMLVEKRRNLRQAEASNLDQAQRNFLKQEVMMLERRKRAQMMEVDRLNSLAVKHSLPVFNFPRFGWHIKEPPIKREPGEETAPSPQIGAAAEAPEVTDLTESTSSSPVATPTPSPQKRNTTSTSTTSSANVILNDKINKLLREKATESDSAVKFDEAMELGEAIVDASFCSPSKAPRCLLGCEEILRHLQHHLDLKMCEDSMCHAVEHHFSHLSRCKHAKFDNDCEYCLRIKEREFARAVDTMEQDEPETNARVQTVVDAITMSLTTAMSAQEREQAVIQLEDELDQAEEHKRDLVEKLGAARTKLRKVRKRITDLSLTDSYTFKMAPHFVKGKIDGAHPRKKQRT